MNEIQKLIKSYGGPAKFMAAYHEQFQVVLHHRSVYDWSQGKSEPHKYVMPMFMATMGKKR